MDKNTELLPCDFKQQERNIIAQKKLVALSDACKCIASATDKSGRIHAEALWSSMSDKQKLKTKHIVNMPPMSDIDVDGDNEVIRYLNTYAEEPFFMEYRLAEMLMDMPSRCGWQEKYQFEVLSKHSKLVSWLVDLPAGGNNALYISKNGMLTRNKHESNAKSIDFIGKCRIADDITADVLIAAKYTEIPGGAQDNQARDLLSFAKAAQKYKNINKNHITIMMLLCDGAYYESAHANLGVSDNMDFRDAVNHDFADAITGCTSTANFDIALSEIIAKIRKNI